MEKLGKLSKRKANCTISGFDSLCSSPFPKWPEQHVLFSVALLGLNARANDPFRFQRTLGACKRDGVYGLQL
ncbi:hypothetical protein NEUTE2DRAFT_73691 [Neurospora tetrasperma FGSC 2509]|nr:hypothetical protein NEUTE2DRAFT_73691 [Neurospora tetrasperma FGSC 2509]